jgi:hypothetical protein
VPFQADVGDERATTTYYVSRQISDTRMQNAKGYRPVRKEGEGLKRGGGKRKERAPTHRRTNKIRKGTIDRNKAIHVIIFIV